MAVTEIAESNPLPGAFIQITSVANVGKSANDFRPIAIMEKLSTGVGEENKNYSITTEEEASRLFGKNSAGHLFYNAFSANNQVALNMIPIDVGTTGTAASLTLTISKAPTDTGFIDFYVFDKYVRVRLDSGVENTIPLVIEKIITEFNGLGGLPIAFSKVGTSGSETGIKIDSLHRSNIIEKIKLEVDYNDTGVEYSLGGAQVGVAPNAQSGQPHKLVSALDSIGEEIYDFVAIPFYNTSQFTEAKDWAEGRRVATAAWDGQIMVVKHIDYATTSTWQFGFNSSAVTVLPDQVKNVEPETLGAIVGAITKKLASGSPARPFQGIELTKIKPSDVFIKERRSVLLSNGISTLIRDGGVLKFERVRTLAEETSVQRDLNDSLVTVYLRRDFKRRFDATFEGKTISAGSLTGENTVSLGTVKSFYLSVYDLWKEAELVDELTSEDVARISLERIEDGVSGSLPVVMLGQFRRLHIEMSFRL